MDFMADVSRILSQIEAGHAAAADQLLPLIYDELRKLAAAKLANEKPEQTPQATAIVHDAFSRLDDAMKTQDWADLFICEQTTTDRLQFL